jgi:hypothetical protein
MIFTYGEFVQTIHMNQVGYFKEALKMPGSGRAESLAQHTTPWLTDDAKAPSLLCASKGD